MTIINNEDMLFNGEHTPAGSTVEVSKELGQYLIGVKRARLPDVPVDGETGSAPAPETTAVTGGETGSAPAPETTAVTGGETGSAPAPETTAVTGSETTALPKGDKKTT